jgi:hypothetical protein
MALEPKIKALNRVQHRLAQLVSDTVSLREAAAETGDPVILELLQQARAALVAVVGRVDAELGQLWKRQPPKRLRNHILHHHKIGPSDLQ